MPITVVRVNDKRHIYGSYCPWECELSGNLWRGGTHKRVDDALVYSDHIDVDATDELDALARAMRILAKLG